MMGGGRGGGGRARAHAGLTCAITCASSGRCLCGLQKTIKSRPRSLRILCGHGPKAVQNRTCPTCSGMGKVRAQQGFFHRRAHLPDLFRHGPDHQEPLQAVRWRGSGREKIALCRSISRLASKPAPASVWRAKAKPACAADLGRPLYFHRSRPSMTFLNATATNCFAACPSA